MLTQEEMDPPPGFRWPAWAVVALMLLTASLLLVGFLFNRGQYVAGGSRDLTYVLLGAIILSYAAVVWAVKRNARLAARAQRPS